MNRPPPLTSPTRSYIFHASGCQACLPCFTSVGADGLDGSMDMALACNVARAAQVAITRHSLAADVIQAPCICQDTHT